MITITNKHIAWGLIASVILVPWLFVFLGYYVLDADGYLTILGTIIAAEIFGLLIFTAIASIHTLCRLLDPTHCNPITIRWTIKLPFKRDSHVISKDTSLLLRKLGQADKNSQEYEEIYKELDKRGTWG